VLAQTATSGRSVSTAQLALLALAAFVLAVSRRPDALFNPQFFAEDGAVWYAQAHNLGALQPLFTPYGGYLQALPRLTAALTQAFPLRLAPLVMNALAILVRIAPAVLVVSRRFQPVLPSLGARFLVAFLYLGLPDSSETLANISNAQWYLALLAFAVLVTPPPGGWPGRGLDVLVVLLSGLSGPFALVLAPVAAAWWWAKRQDWTLVLTGVLALCALAQAVALLAGGFARSKAPLGASVDGLVRILGVRVFLDAIAGRRVDLVLFRQPALHASLWPAVVCLALLLLVLGTAVWKGPGPLRLLAGLAAGLLAAALSNPLVDLRLPQWPLLQTPGAANRYFVISTLAVLLSLSWLVLQPDWRLPRLLATPLLLLALLVGIPADWWNPPLADLGYRSAVRRYEEAPPGSSVVIPINPPGWKMVLVRAKNG
jgi:hypothetical protein